jgi:hypothetical protein
MFFANEHVLKLVKLAGGSSFFDLEQSDENSNSSKFPTPVPLGFNFRAWEWLGVKLNQCTVLYHIVPYLGSSRVQDADQGDEAPQAMPPGCARCSTCDVSL